MAIYKVQDPAGNLREIEGPDGATDEQIIAAAQKLFAPKGQAEPEKYTATGSFAENALAGFGKAFVDTGRGIRQLGATVGNKVGLVSNDTLAGIDAEVEEVKRLDAPLMETGGGITGNIVGQGAQMIVPGAALSKAPKIGAAVNAFTKANPIKAAAIGGAGFAATQPVAEGESRLLNTGIGFAGGAGGQFLGQKIGQAVTNRLASRQANAVAKAEQNAVRDATLRQSLDAGYVVPPSTSNPTVKNRILESFSGKAQTSQAASLKNQTITDRLIREDLGLPENAPLTIDTLKNIRGEAGKVYKQIANAGRIKADDEFHMDMLRLSGEADRINIDFPDLNVGAKDEIVRLTNALTRDSFDARSAMAAIKSLRSDGSKNMSGLVAASSPEKAALGRAQLAAAEAMENQVMRHLHANGLGELADSFDRARTLIAKTYSVQNALNADTGHVAAGKLSKQLQKGKYLSGGTERAARFAGAFPKAAQEIKDSGPVSAVDAIGAMGLGAFVDPTFLAYPALRMGGREALLRGPGQRLALPNYAPSRLGTGGLNALEFTSRFGAPIGVTGGLLAQ